MAGERSTLRYGFEYLFAARNRGLLLDVVVFVLNLTVMAVLARGFAATIHRASGGDQLAAWVLFAMGAALLVLPPLGATLKRWHYHQRIPALKVKDTPDPTEGCLFNPIMYFCLMIVVFAAVDAFIFQFFYGDHEPEGPFVASIFVGLVLMIVHTVLAYRYFSPPKGPPKSKFLRSPISGVLGDACLFANMLIFQLIWNLLASASIPRPHDLSEFFSRLLVFAFVALLVYFPPRMFYLAEDIGKRRTWLMIFVANLPILARVLFGFGGSIQW